MKFIKIGHIIKPFGLKGEMKVYPYTDFVKERFKKQNKVYLYQNKEYKEYIINSCREHKGLLNVQFLNYEDINLIEGFRDLDIYYDMDNIEPLKEGYYVFELKGLNALDQNNNYLGKVIDVEEGMTHNNLRIKKDNGESFLVPNIKQFIIEVNTKENYLKINVIEGLI